MLIAPSASISPPMRYGSREFQRGDMYNLPFHSPTFDTVTMDRVLAGAKRPQSALAEAARALKSGGRLVILEEFDRMAEAWQANPIVTLRAWLKDAGLTSERLRPIDTEYGHLIVVIARHGAKQRVAA
jgi:ArsR family transcriptional regulator